MGRNGHDHADERVAADIPEPDTGHVGRDECEEAAGHDHEHHEGGGSEPSVLS
jgi:hypothetical protein